MDLPRPGFTGRVRPRRYALPMILALAGIPIAGAAQTPDAAIPLGVGMVSPRLDTPSTLHFHGPPRPGLLPSELPTVDSVTFVAGEHNVEISTAPPWLVPEVLKLDYELMLFRAVTVTRGMVEVIVNETDGRTAWLSREEADFLGWAEFLLGVFSVEVIDEASNPVRLKALDHASAVGSTALPLRPLAVRGDWIEVTSEGLREEPPVRGWIRWRSGDALLIRYSLLS